MVSELIFYVNGKKICDPAPDPEDTLLQYMREKLGLRGSKLGCAEGGCGACTVMVSKFDRQLGRIIHFSVNACLAPICSIHGCAVTTVEGIGSTKTKLHAVQERLAKSHGSQCGFCTPGIVMSMYTLLRNNPQPEQHDMESAFEGNLCRCTGYRPILEGFRSFTKQACSMGDKCCKMGGSGCGGGDAEDLTEVTTPQSANIEWPEYDRTQEPIFPPELKLRDLDLESIHYKGERVEWFRPTTLDDLLKLKATHPTAKLVCGNTEIGVEIKFKNQHYPVIIAPTDITELLVVEVKDTGVILGASVTLSRMDSVLKDLIASLPECETRVFAAIREMLRWFAGHQIRNVSSIAGNLMTASPISDLNPLYIAAGVTLDLMSQGGGCRTVKLDEKFFLGYRKIEVKADEILISIHIPKTSQYEFFYGYKQAHRKEDDIATVNAGLRVCLDEHTKKVKSFSAAYGGMAPITVTCVHTSRGLVGKDWNDSLMEEACNLLKSDLPLSDTAPGGMINYRKTLTISFFYKFYLSVRRQLQQDAAVPEVELCATEPLERGLTKGIQVYQEVDDQVGECWRAVPHKSAQLQCTGEAQYVDDLLPYKDEMYMALVFSTVAHGKVKSIDSSAAMSCEGVIDFLCAKDVPGNNVYRFTQDELIFANEEVTCMGQIVGAVFADTQRHAQLAAKKVKVDYEELPAIFTITEAIEKESYFDKPIKMWKGDVKEGFEHSEHILEGEISVGGQEHFYLETQAVLAVPRENHEMEVFASTQNPTELQMFIGSMLNVPTNRVNIRVKRMGGGFGGKETRGSILALPAALGAYKHQRAVRSMMDRDEDMISTGTRHSFLGKYKVGYNRDGRIIAVETKLYNNAGNTRDLSISVLERGLFSCDNAYNIQHFSATGWCCKTNIPSNTAFRGFGGPQGMIVMEDIIAVISSKLNIPELQIREMHLYKEGGVTHFGQACENCNLEKCWLDVLSQSDYSKREGEVKDYNRKNRWRKRGICAIPTKFGISFTASFLNQSGALVHIYNDGNVLLSHGGTEMGQGLFTKMIQVASTALQIPADKIYTNETSTSTVINTSPTAASCGSDLNGGAVLAACLELRQRLEPFIKAKPGDTWEQWVRSAYFDRVSLSAVGYYSTPNIYMDFETSMGTPFNYFTYGAAVSEVEIDCLTGDHQVLRTDIVMDVGKSLNPAIDIGQIEGGFVQGYGLFCLEQLKVMRNKGHLLTRGPGAYKIPGFGNIPQEFNVTLLKDAPNVKAVYSSKAIGEPPLFLSASVFFAIRSAIADARQDAGASEQFSLDSPCTPERIRMTCQDKFTKQFTDESSVQIPASSFFVEP